MSTKTTITLDTKLSDLDWDTDAQWIGEDLIPTAQVGDDWGGAWDRVERRDGTVRDLRDTLVDRAAK